MTFFLFLPRKLKTVQYFPLANIIYELPKKENSDFTYVNTGLTKRVVTWFGLSVSYTSDYIAILCPSLYKGSLSGLCQNMNTDWRDDFRLRNGSVLEYPGTGTGTKLTWQEFETAKDWIEGSNQLGGCIEEKENPTATG